MAERCLDGCAWCVRTFSWWLALLATGGVAAVAIASKYLKDSVDNVKAILEEVNVKEDSITNVMTGTDWILTISWVLLGVLLGGIAYNAIIKFFHSTKRDKFRDGFTEGSSKCGCAIISTSRIIFNITHIVALLSCIWFMAVLCAQLLILVALVLTEEVAGKAQGLWHSSSAVINSLATNLNQWIADNAEVAHEIESLISTYCYRVRCDETITAALSKLRSLSTAFDSASDALDASQSGLCPSNACLNLDMLWFLEEKGRCICNVEVVTNVEDSARAGKHDAITSSICLLVAFLVMLLILSKTAMNLKSLLKDLRWMSRMRKAQAAGKLHVPGMSLALNVDSSFVPPGSTHDELFTSATAPPLPPPAPSGQYPDVQPNALDHHPDRSIHELPPAEKLY